MMMSLSASALASSFREPPWREQENETNIQEKYMVLNINRLLRTPTSLRRAHSDLCRPLLVGRLSRNELFPILATRGSRLTL